MSGDGLTILAVLVSVAAHEAGHAFAAQALGVRWQVFFRFPVSLGVKAEPSRRVGLGGPAASLLVSFAAFPLHWPALWFFSILYCLLSLPPVKPCDGYWIFR